MKTKLCIGALLVLSVLVLTGCHSAAITMPASTGHNTAITVTSEEAQNTALNHAGLKEADVTRLRAELDRDDGITHYDVEFHNGIYEYSYEINAKTGKIMEWDKNIDD